MITLNAAVNILTIIGVKWTNDTESACVLGTGINTLFIAPMESLGMLSIATKNTMSVLMGMVTAFTLQ